LRKRSTGRFNFGDFKDLFAVFAEASAAFFWTGFLAKIFRAGRVCAQRAF